MKLVLAEKPSVAQSIAKVLGATKREDGYLEGNGYVVSWCVGHLVELSQPEAYDEKYNKWAYADLPIFPDQWKYQVSASTKKQFGILKKLMARKDVESLVCATDAGREGELIFRLVYQQAGCRKPFERLWISSMEDSAIREGFEQLKPSTEYDALYEAALCRERADWLVGINATRLFSTLYGQTLNVGRVMTPTLAMVVMREAAISAFRPEPFYTVELAFQDFTASGERMKQKVLADDVARKCVGSVLNVTKAENKEKSEKPPALYDLTSLQRDANRVLGFTAQQTLDYTQSLYEKKLVTYPRTDSRYLTSDMKDMLPELIKSLFNIFPVEDVKNVPVHAAQVINDKKVSDHHAIIPTKEAIKCSLDDLPKGEQAILRLIATRLFCAVGEPFRYNESVIELSDGNYIFSAKGKTTVQSGWKIFSGKPADKDTPSEALAISIGEHGKVDLPYMAELLGTPGEYDSIKTELQGVIFKDPMAPDDPVSGWQTADEYLSGDVRSKLRIAQMAAQKDSSFEINVQALEKAQPKDLDASEIDVRLGATWIDSAYIQQFMQETFETPYYLRRTIEVKFSELTAEWRINGKSSPSQNDVAAYTTYGTERANAYRILEETLNLKDIRIYDTIEDADGKQKRVLNKKETTLAQQKQQAIKDAFRDWIWKDSHRREALVTKYNELFNSTRPREYDGSHIRFGGMNPDITLREHQRNAIAHVLYGGNTLLAHEVGAGKTFEMAASAMESKRLGLSQKALFVVPNHLTLQWANEFLHLYPSAKLLVATKKDFETANRKKFCARIATGDYDAVIIGHSQFEKIPLSPERQERQLREQIDEIEGAIAELKYQNGENFTIKQMEKTRKSLQTRLDKLLSTDRNIGVQGVQTR